MVRLPTVDAAVDEYTATVFTDSCGEWASEANAYDGDWGTYADNTVFSNGDDYPSAYASGFDSGASGSGTITQVDIIVRMSYSSSSASDQWGITLDVGASTDNVLSAMSTAVYSLNNNTFTDVTEPNGGGWSWAEVQAAQIHLDGEKVGGADSDVFNVYEFAFKITTTPSGNDYTAYPDGSFSLGGTTALAASFSTTLAEGFALVGITVLAGAFAVTLIQGFSLVGVTSLITAFSKILSEGFALTGITNVSVIIQKLISDGFVLTGIPSLVAAFSKILSDGFALTGIPSLVAAFSKILSDGFALTGIVSAFKVIILTIQDSFVFVGLVVLNIEEITRTLIYEIFFSLNMWGYLGPIALVIGGYFVSKKDKSLGIFVFIVECLVIAQYLALVDATPNYWWQIIILLLGVILCTIQLGGDKL
jgi:hypothetical protein